jgi:signal transduction histidine kinase
MPEKLSLSPLTLAELVGSVVREHQTVAEANQITIDNQLVNAPDQTNWIVLAEFDALRTILGNLLSNAIRYSKCGGQVTLKAESNNDRIELLVIDQGIGIPAQDLDRIFERFYTVDKARSRESGGTGLGLAIVKAVARMHGGRAFASSGGGHNTIGFTIARQ